MKISKKLPLAFALALGLLLAGALFGIYRLNAALNLYEADVLHHVAGYKKGAEVSANFATAIQEWKNVLLRGKDPKDLEKYWSAHQKEMAAVNEKVKDLATLVDPGSPEKAQVNQLATDMLAAQDGYKRAFEAFKAADHDPAAGDKAAKGVDRAAAKLLEEVRQTLSKAEAAATEEAKVLARTSNRIALSVMAVVAVLAFVGALRLSSAIFTPLANAAAVAERVALGDLTSAVDSTAQDEIGDLLRSLKSMQNNLVDVVARVRQGAEGVATASAEIAQGNHDLSARTEQQAAALEETAASMHQLDATVKQSADSAHQANQLAANASSIAQQGGRVVEQVVDTMRGINEASRKISDIISVIDGIAFQTNILALNAAVEAARAGEQGRGFAVVASEVRSLAGRSAEAAKEIKALINTSVARVEQGTVLVDQAGATMNEVVSSIQRVTDIVGEITAASREQASGVSQVGDAITSIDQTTQQNAALVEEMAAAASSLKSQSQDLVQTVAVFNLGGNYS